MNILQHTTRAIIKKSFKLSVWTIERFSDVDSCAQKVRYLQGLPDGTVGKDIANCLKANRLRLVPNYESHDLKHVLLDFKMTPVDEIRMQAFMIGNGNYSIPSFAIFLYGACLLPDLWSTFYKDFSRGTKSKPISTWSIEEYAHCNTAMLRDVVFNYSPTTNSKPNYMANLIKTGAYTAIIAGIAGMMFCLPFLFSSHLEDLVGAGFPFLGGAILASGGLIALSNIKSSSKLESQQI